MPVVLGLALAVAGCQSQGAKGPGMAMPPAAVSVITAKAENVPISNEYTAQTFARDMVEVRARVSGNIEKRLFQVGSDVAAGQTLYVLDVRPYQAVVEKARGDLRQSEASEEFARQQVSLIQAEADCAGEG